MSSELQRSRQMSTGMVHHSYKFVGVLKHPSIQAVWYSKSCVLFLEKNYILSEVHRPIPSHSSIDRIVNEFRKYGCVVWDYRKCQQIDEQHHIPL